MILFDGIGVVRLRSANICVISNTHVGVKYAEMEKDYIQKN